ncbi:MAG TPA: hypothetical protein VFX51_25465 [Solirubrobacteraceae bacterium]|nr:hypothetical protein [Solirubrobacteraceae bacterium]
MDKPRERPTPPDHRAYPRGKPSPPPKPASERRVPAWTRVVPPDRSFPRS